MYVVVQSYISVVGKQLLKTITQPPINITRQYRLLPPPPPHSYHARPDLARERKGSSKVLFHTVIDVENELFYISPV